MILHPAVIALLLSSFIISCMMLYSTYFGLQIVRKWDIKSGSEVQLNLERRTYLVSTLVQYALLFEVISIFLFIYTAEDIHTLLVGAMCATGSLNANPFGFPALYAKIAVFFAAASWIAVNHIDNKAEDYPLIKWKYRLLIAVLVLLITEFILQFQYFLKINPNVITSCCGVMFGEKSKGIASSLAAFPPLPAKILFYSLFAVTIAAGIASYKHQRKPFTYLLSVFSFMFFIFSVVAIISFVSLYFYQLPTHHCPFCILQKEYYYIGYPLYAFLFAGTFLGIMVGVVERFKKIPSMNRIIPYAQQRWTLYSIIFLTIFMIIASAPIILLPFRLY